MKIDRAGRSSQRPLMLLLIFSIYYTFNFLRRAPKISCAEVPLQFENVKVNGDARGKCQHFPNNGEWNKDLTKWMPSEGSITSLDSFWRPNNEPLGIFNHFLVCGDSTFAGLFRNLPFSRVATRPVSQVKVAGRCNLMDYYGLEKAKNWISPDRTLEGPVSHGLKSPFCTDCRGCNSTLMASHQEDGTMEKSFEYIAVEFARDREFQTSKSSTSQETLGLYLGKTYRRDLCVVGSGLHDVLLDITVERYAQNVMDYVDALKQHCRKICWMQISATLEKKEFKQQNSFLQALNSAVLRSCAEDSGLQVLIFDIWNMSLPRALHVDNVHHNVGYYEQLGELILSPLLKAV